MKRLLIIPTLFIAVHLILSFFAHTFFSLDGDFPHKLLLKDFDLPNFINAFANFDGAHYIRIARWGYVNYEQVYFPLYPLLIKVSSLLFGNYLFSSLFVSYIGFVGGIYMFYKLCKIVNKNISVWALTCLLAFPTSFFFITSYTESLFFFLVCASLYFLFSKKYGIATGFIILASFTRVQGVLLLIPVILYLYKDNKVDWRISLRQMGLLLSPLSGILIYGFYLYRFFSDPLLFYHAQEKFGAERTSSSIIFIPQVLYRYLKIILTFDFSLPYFIAIFEVAIFLFVCAILTWDAYNICRSKKGIERLGINLFSFACLILPTLTGTFSSVPRYALVSLGVFIAFSQIKHNLLKICLVVIFALIHVAVFLIFIKGYFVS